MSSFRLAYPPRMLRPGKLLLCGARCQALDELALALISDGWDVLLPTSRQSAALSDVTFHSEKLVALIGSPADAFGWRTLVEQIGTQAPDGVDAVVDMQSAPLALKPGSKASARSSVMGLYAGFEDDLELVHRLLSVLRSEGSYVIGAFDGGGGGVEVRPLMLEARRVLVQLACAEQPSRRVRVGVLGSGEEPALVPAPWTLADLLPKERFGGPSRGGIAPWRLRRVRSHIETHLAERISVRDLAEVAELSVFHFCRAFGEATGLTPGRYVVERRIERAKALLLSDNLALVEVALACGFAGQSHFTTAFRKSTGFSPGKWREASLRRKTRQEPLVSQSIQVPPRAVSV